MPLDSEIRRALKGFFPPMELVEIKDPESPIYAYVTLLDGRTLWRIERERGALFLLATPAAAPSVFYDAELLGRLVGLPFESPERTLPTIVRELQFLREPLAPFFVAGAEQNTLRRLAQLARSRDNALLGRPLGRETSGE